MRYRRRFNNKERLNVITWKWGGARAFYNAEHVNTLYAMLTDNLTIPFDFTCITDDATGIDARVKIVDLPQFEHLPPNRRGGTSCFVRLWAFSEEAKAVLGNRILSLDLDIVVTNNLDALFSQRGDFVAWFDPASPAYRYQGGFFIHQTGTRKFLWDEFQGQETQNMTRSVGLNGTDQAWLSYRLPVEHYVNKSYGLWKAKEFAQNNNPFDDSCLVQLQGDWPPWDSRGERMFPDLCKIWQKYNEMAKNNYMVRSD